MALVGQMVRCLPCKLSYMSAGDRRLNRSARNLKWNAAYSEDSSSNRSEENRAKDGTDITRRSLLLSSPALLTLSSSDLAKSEVVEVVQRSKDSSINRIEEFEKRVSSFVLSNGMRWIVAERHNAPIISCHLYADVGAADEKDGQTGIAHLLEHLAFKGTKQVGTTDWRTESEILDQLDEVFYDQLAALDSGNFPLAKRLSEKLEALKEKASRFAVPNEYGAILSREGAVGLNAQTSQDSTVYYVSLPSNKLSLWMALESARFRDPVFRELYSEKEVVFEERRLRVENSPLGRFTEEFASLAFPGQPYGRPVIGYPGDLVRIGRREVETFFREKYNPENIVCSVVGDVDPADVQRMAELYFGPWSPQNSPSRIISPSSLRGDTWQPSILPPANQRELRMSLPGGPLYMEGYWRPSEASKDDAALSVLTQILSGSRSSRFYKSLVSSGKLLAASSVGTFPGGKMSTLALLYGVPPTGKSLEWVSDCLNEEIELLKNEGVTAAELAPVKKLTTVGLMDLFSSNEGLGSSLCKYECQAGGWRGLLREAMSLQNVTSEEVQEVAQKLFRSDNRVAGYVAKSFS